MIRVAIVHYHLRRGGVTRVIENAVRALRGEADVLVLTGEAPADDFPAPVAVVEGLNYDDEPADERGKVLGKRMLETARQHWGAGPDLWHVHNHSLGKNIHFPEALQFLLEMGGRFLLQIHDFAEDGRPTLYAGQIRQLNRSAALLYPMCPQIHYAVLNGRDEEHLRTAGLAEDQLSFLPNAVSVERTEALPAPRDKPTKEPLLLYPTRAIRRKNLGEILLLAALNGGALQFATTLRPENPAWRQIHEEWETFSRKLDLNIAFGIGESTTESFSEIMESADAVVTTSIAEGFGLAFLEPFLFGKPLVGRDLPPITQDFKDVGIALESLYPSLPVRPDLFDEESLCLRFRRAWIESRSAYGWEGEATVDAALEAFLGKGEVDFGRLDERAQREVIQRVHQTPSAIGNPGLTLADDSIEGNRQTISETYGLENYGRRLLAEYRSILEAPTGIPATLDAEAVLEPFLAPWQFNLLRT